MWAVSSFSEKTSTPPILPLVSFISVCALNFGDRLGIWRTCLRHRACDDGAPGIKKER
jgi:hypothetical protein